MANLAEAGDRLVREKEELEEQLVNMETAIKALTVNRDELADEKDRLLGTVVDLEEERANLRSSMADLERLKGELLEERKCLEEKLTEAARRCDDLQEERSDLEEKFSNLEQQHVSSLQTNVRKHTLYILCEVYMLILINIIGGDNKFFEREVKGDSGMYKYTHPHIHGHTYQFHMALYTYNRKTCKHMTYIICSARDTHTSPMNSL